MSLTNDEREWIADAITDTFMPYGRDFDPQTGARLFEARLSTLLERSKGDAWHEGWRAGYHDVASHRTNPYREPDRRIAAREHVVSDTEECWCGPTIRRVEGK